MLEPDEVKHFVPDGCSNGSTRPVGFDENPTRFQQVELSPVIAVEIGYVRHTLKCRTCGKRENGILPASLHTGDFGLNICAFTGLLSGRYRLSKRLFCEMMHDVFGVQMALGTVSNHEQRSSKAIEGPVEKAAAFVRNRGVVHADAAGWTQGKAKAWMWVIACVQVATFAIDKSRSNDVAERLIGEAFKETIVSDRWGRYTWMDTDRRQRYWSHLIRGWQS